MAIFKTATRKISNRGQLKVIGQFFSHKNNASISWESQVERDYYYLLEYADDVIGYVHQPETFTLWIDGIKRSYTPDVRTVHRSGEIKYSEVKFEYPKPESEMAMRMVAAQNYFEANGYGFSLIDSDEIRKDHLVSNIRLLYRYARWNMENFPAAAVEDFLVKNPKSTVTDLLSAISACPAQGVFRMIYDNKIITDLNTRQFDYSSELQASGL